MSKLVTPVAFSRDMHFFICTRYHFLLLVHHTRFFTFTEFSSFLLISIIAVFGFFFLEIGYSILLRAESSRISCAAVKDFGYTLIPYPNYSLISVIRGPYILIFERLRRAVSIIFSLTRALNSVSVRNTPSLPASFFSCSISA